MTECYGDRRAGKPTIAAGRRLEALVTMHWSMVHGLATLLIDGSLCRRFRTARERDAHVLQTMELFMQSTGTRSG